MDHQPPPPDLMRAFRQVLVARGFAFCDEGDEQEQPQFPAPPEGAFNDSELLLMEGVEASSTDAPQQAIGHTLEEDSRTFWSSTGSADPECTEFLLYKLRSPLCLVRHVQLVVFRAQYQWGAPIYPPSFVSFQAGPSPWSLSPPAVKYPVAATDVVQSFPLPADLPVGRYLRVNLHGKRQRQLEDMQYYHAIQRVEAFGRQLGASEALRLRDWLARRSCPLPTPGVLPAHAAAEAAMSPQQQREREEQQQQQREDAGQGHAGYAEGGETGSEWWWQEQAALEAGAADAALQQESSSGSESSLSFSG